MSDDFLKKMSELINSETGDFFGVKHLAQYRSVAGISNFTSSIGFLEAVDEDVLNQIPDYVLSGSIEADLSITIAACCMALRRTKYLPNGAEVGDDRSGAYLRNWRDFQILNFEGQHLYTEEMFEDLEEHESLGQALWLIERDICEDGRIFSEDWYNARMLLEYFREDPVPPDSAFLIGQLDKELSVKRAHEAELSEYYSKLAASKEGRAKGSDSTKNKAAELRDYCVRLFAKMVQDEGMRLGMAPDLMKARALRRRALEERRGDFLRNGTPYKDQWFLKHIIEDRKYEIIEEIERMGQ